MLSRIICEDFQPGDSSVLGKEISQKFIQHSSQGIFNEHERSIIELILNSVDAYRYLSGQSSIGKFGMGFYSIFAYIINSPESSIVITSHTLTQHWKAVLTYKDNDIHVEFMDILPASTGFRIDIHYTHIHYNLCFESFIENYVRFITGIRIYYKENTFPGKYLNQDTQSTALIEIIEHPDNHISVEDYASGVSKEVFYKTMLIPGISTKGLSHQTMPKIYGQLTDIHPQKDEEFNMWDELRVLVGEIPVFTCSQSNPDDCGNIYVIQMPKETNLPVSRDSILLTDDNCRVWNLQIHGLIEQWIAKQEYQRIYILHSLLKKLPHEFLCNAINQLVDVLPEQNIYYLSREFKDLPISGKFIYVQPEDVPIKHYIKLEEYLIKHLSWESTIFQGKLVNLCPNIAPGLHCGPSNRLLFIKQRPENIRDFVLAYPEHCLSPFISSTVKYDELIIQRFTALQTYFQLTDIHIYKQFVKTIPEDFLPRYYAELCAYLNILVKLTKRTTSYGSNQPIFKLYIKYPSTDIHIKDWEKFSIVFQHLITYQFKYYRKYPSTYIANIWSNLYLPTTNNHHLILEVCNDEYEYAALCSMIYLYPNISRLKIHISSLQRYWQSKLNTTLRREQLLTWMGEPLELAKILHDAYTSLDTMNYTIYKPISLKKCINEYRLTELLKHAYRPDFRADKDLYTIKHIPTGTTQLIPIAINQVIVNPVRQLFNILAQCLPYLDIELNVHNDEIVIQCNVKLTSEELLFLSLPYTTKFLEIYGMSSKVQFIHQEYTIDDIPIYEGDLVMDIHRRIYKSSHDRDYLIVYLPCEHIQNTLLEAGEYITNVMSFCKEIKYHGVVYKSCKIPHVVADKSTEYLVDKSWSIDPTYTSWIFKDGIPYMELEKFKFPDELLSQEDIRIYLSKGLLIDFMINARPNELTEYGYYEDILYYKLLSDLLAGVVDCPNVYLRNLDSHGHYAQLRIKYNSDAKYLSDFLAVHKPWITPDGQKYINNNSQNIATLINYTIKQSPTSLENIQHILTNEYPQTPMIVCEVVKLWFTNKFKSKHKSGNLIILNNYVVQHLQHFVKVFWNIAKSLQIPELHMSEECPELNIKSLSDESLLGYYNPSTHSIILNATKELQAYEFPKIDWESIIQSKDAYLGNIFPPQTLIHELYHALLQNDHKLYHNSSELTINGHTEEYTFDDGAMKIYQEIILGGCIDQLFIQ